MPRPKTKPELLEAADAQFENLWKLIDALPEDAQYATFSFGADFLQKQSAVHWTRDKNLRDVLIHLFEWHQLLLIWLRANRDKNIGGVRPFLPEPYTWKTYGQMNVDFWEKHQDTSYEQAQEMLNESHAEVLTLIDSFSDDELFVKKHFPWTGTSNVATYCISATSSHYDWAMKKIKQHGKTYQEGSK